MAAEPSPQISPAAARVLNVFLEDPAIQRYGFELMQLASISSGSLYPMLARFQRAGWIESAKEDIDPHREGRPARRYYLLTGDGIRAARHEMAILSERYRPPEMPSILPRPGYGLT